MIDAMQGFVDSLATDNESTKQAKIDQVRRYVSILTSMPDEEVEWITKKPENVFFDLEAYARGDGTWEKLKMARKSHS